MHQQRRALRTGAQAVVPAITVITAAAGQQVQSLAAVLSAERTCIFTILYAWNARMLSDLSRQVVSCLALNS